MVSGPDFEPQNRWRRRFDDAPIVTPIEFQRGLARRAEAQIRNSWEIVPTQRSVCFRYTAEHTNSVLVPFARKTGEPSESSAKALVQAAKNLYQKLWQGFTEST